MMWMKWPLMTTERDPGFTVSGLGLFSLAEK